MAEKATSTIVPVIMAGGIGTRLWPLSRDDKPKQFLNPLGGKTLIQRTVERLLGDDTVPAIETIVVVTNSDFAEQTREQLAEFTGAVKVEYLFEPCLRNTAPALAAATHYVGQKYDNAVIAMLAADHHIVRETEFRRLLKLSCDEAARDPAILTFGIKPDRPETGYGYIRYKPGDVEVAAVEAFVEKPDYDTAVEWLKTGEYLWNSGMFVSSVETMERAFVELQPDILENVVASIEGGIKSEDAVYLEPTHYARCDSISIDYAIMEKANYMKVVPADIGWFDVGAWEQVSRIAELDSSEASSLLENIQLDCKSTYVLPDARQIISIGTKDLVIVDTPDALLVADRNRTQEVKAVYEKLKQDGSKSVTSSFQAMSPVQRSKYNIDRVGKWLREHALPFWHESGGDALRGGIIEAFDRDGTALAEKPRRVRVLARQLFAFSHSSCMGWSEDTGPFLEKHYDYLLTNAWGSDGGWVTVLDPDGAQFDQRVTLYDQAFVLLALAWMYKATGKVEVLNEIDKTVSFIDSALDGQGENGLASEWDALAGIETKRFPVAVGEVGLQEPSARFQKADQIKYKHANPHMHMLEACLALYEATGNGDYLARSQRIVDLFRTKMFQVNGIVLPELYDEAMNPVLSNSQQWMEPGHMFEWAHLLLNYGRHSGQDLVGVARELVAAAETFGKSPTTGLVMDKYSTDWQPIAASSRFWPQLERLRALASLERAGHSAFAGEIENTIDLIFRHYLSSLPMGLWEDCLDGDGNLISDTVPQSTFYHIVAAFSEYLSLKGSHANPLAER